MFTGAGGGGGHGSGKRRCIEAEEVETSACESLGGDFMSMSGFICWQRHLLSASIPADGRPNYERGSDGRRMTGAWRVRASWRRGESEGLRVRGQVQ
jgi:hypothetical protein